MIISVHIPKTAGSSFQAALSAQFGARLGMANQGSTIPWTAEEKQRAAAVPDEQARHAEETARRFDAIRGHFFARAFLKAFPQGRFCTLLRDPVERVASHYHFIRGLTASNKPLHLHVRSITLLEFAAIPENQNLQSQYCAGLGLQDFAFIGLTHRFDDSLALFNKTFGLALTTPDARNVNRDRSLPQSAANRYGLSEEERTRIAALNGEDMKLFAQAQALFETRV